MSLCLCPSLSLSRFLAHMHYNGSAYERIFSPPRSICWCPLVTICDMSTPTKCFLTLIESYLKWNTMSHSRSNCATVSGLFSEPHSCPIAISLSRAVSRSLSFSHSLPLSLALSLSLSLSLFSAFHLTQPCRMTFRHNRGLHRCSSCQSCIIPDAIG